MIKKEKKNSPDRSSKTETFADGLAGLIYISETDADILPFAGDNTSEVSAEEIRKQTGTADEARIETVDLEDFFDRLTANKEWYGNAEKERAARFQKLKEQLTRELTDVKVFRVGTIRLDIYVVGIDAHGRLAGVKTKAVET